MAAGAESGGARTSGARGVGPAHAALVVVQLCFGLFPVFGTWAMGAEGLAPTALAAWRIAVGALVLGAIAALVHGRAALPRRPRDLGLLTLGSLLGVTFNQGLYLEGLSRSSATNAGLVMALIPVFTFAVAAAVRQERFAPVRALGVVVALAGTLSLPGAGPHALAGGRGLGVGEALMAANALCYAGYLVLTRPLAQRFPPLAVIAWVYALALPAVPLFARGGELAPASATARVWGSLAFVLAFPTVLAYLLNVFALSRVRASTTAVYVYSQVLISGTAGALLLGERPGPGTLRAALLVFLGIWLVARRPPASATGAASATATSAAGGSAAGESAAGESAVAAAGAASAASAASPSRSDRSLDPLPGAEGRP